MKIALIGYGKMGRAIEQIAPNFGQTVVAKIDSKSTESDWNSIQKADVCIDFSQPELVLNHVKKIATYQKPLVLGTTGWSEHLKEVKDLIERKQLGFIYASNFAIGLNLFLEIVKKAATLINPLDQYDLALTEVHHREKKDAPSGTALELARILLNQIDRKTHILTELKNAPIEKEALLLSSIRLGTVFGEHTIQIDSPEDSITLTHRAHNRFVWAKGALQAAEWIINKKGFYSLNDLLEI